MTLLNSCKYSKQLTRVKRVCKSLITVPLCANFLMCASASVLTSHVSSEATHCLTSMDCQVFVLLSFLPSLFLSPAQFLSLFLSACLPACLSMYCLSVYNVHSFYVTIRLPTCLSYSTPSINEALPKGCHLDVVGGPSTPHDPESDAGGSVSSWQSHPSR
jgi:hypothetical protein